MLARRNDVTREEIIREWREACTEYAKHTLGRGILGRHDFTTGPGLRLAQAERAREQAGIPIESIPSPDGCPGSYPFLGIDGSNEYPSARPETKTRACWCMDCLSSAPEYPNPNGCIYD